jgi:hypothetical protein
MPIQQTRPEAGFHLAGHFHSPFPLPVSDRLADLQRQRALAQEQVAWFDREIAKETGRPALSAPAPAAPVLVTPVIPRPTAPASDEAAARAAQEIIAQYQEGHDPQSAAKNMKRGCYLAFCFALGAVALIFLTAYFIYTRRG